MVIAFIPRNKYLKWGYVLTTIQDLWKTDNFPFKHMLIDVGLSQLFRDGELRYDDYWIKQYRQTVESFEQAFRGRVWAIIPDYPPKWRGCGKVKGYIDKTIEMIRKWPTDRADIWIPVIHWENEPIMRISQVLEKYDEVIEPFPRIAIAGGAQNIDTRNIAYVIVRVKERWPEKQIHGLALGLDRFQRIPINVVDSVDLGHNFFVTNYKLRGLNAKEYTEFLFVTWLQKYLYYLGYIEQ